MRHSLDSSRSFKAAKPGHYAGEEDLFCFVFQANTPRKVGGSHAIPSDRKMVPAVVTRTRAVSKRQLLSCNPCHKYCIALIFIRFVATNTVFH